ncbi:ribosylnicotinamide kinase [Orbilia ellipsospora]|uniref:Ribosylnicotinamide kinase n=1 Tax=Orbilia ellipsospora TaxID=2528407 RepID=A0AAV9X4R2_9PEZI
MASICIAISGPSSSGKTSLSRLLRAAFTSKTLPHPHPTKCIILHGDDFYIPDSSLPLVPLPPTGEKVQDWDCPEALNFPQFLESVRYAKLHGAMPEGHQSYEGTHAVGVEESILRLSAEGGEGGAGTGGKERIVEMERRVVKWLERVEEGMGKRIENVVIVDGFLLFGEGVLEELKEEFDVKLLIRTPYEKAKKRREDREGYVTVEGFWSDPPGYFERLVWPAYLKQHSYLYKDGNMDSGVLTQEAFDSGIRTPKETDQSLMQTLEWAVSALEDTTVEDVMKNKK